MSESILPKAARRILTQLSKGVLSVPEAAGKLGGYLDSKMGTEDKSLFRASDPAKRSSTYKQRKGGGGK